MISTGHIEIYQAEDGQTRIEVRLENDTLWLSQAQLGELFAKDVNTVGEHIGNIFKEGELDRAATTRKFRVVRSEGTRQVAREIDHYDLDVAISVGYRVNSKKGTQFRIWATRRLRDYLVDGYAVNRQRFEQNTVELEQSFTLMRKVEFRSRVPSFRTQKVAYS